MTRSNCAKVSPEEAQNVGVGCLRSGFRACGTRNVGYRFELHAREKADGTDTGKPMRRRQRYFRVKIKTSFSKRRKAWIRASAASSIASRQYRGTSQLMEEIDTLADILTRDREYFHIKIAPASSL
jgi:hypothetical protein